MLPRFGAEGARKYGLAAVKCRRRNSLAAMLARFGAEDAGMRVRAAGVCCLQGLSCALPRLPGGTAVCLCALPRLPGGTAGCLCALLACARATAAQGFLWRVRRLRRRSSWQSRPRVSQHRLRAVWRGRVRRSSPRWSRSRTCRTVCPFCR